MDRSDEPTCEVCAAHPDAHPEDHCHRCGGRNLSWVTPGAVWDPVMRPDGPDAPWKWHEIICPQCLDDLAGGTTWLILPAIGDGERYTAADERRDIIAAAVAPLLAACDDAEDIGNHHLPIHQIRRILGSEK